MDYSPQCHSCMCVVQFWQTKRTVNKIRPNGTLCDCWVWGTRDFTPVAEWQWGKNTNITERTALTWQFWSCDLSLLGANYWYGIMIGQNNWCPESPVVKMHNTSRSWLTWVSPVLYVLGCCLVAVFLWRWQQRPQQASCLHVQDAWAWLLDRCASAVDGSVRFQHTAHTRSVVCGLQQPVESERVWPGQIPPPTPPPPPSPAPSLRKHPPEAGALLIPAASLLVAHRRKLIVIFKLWHILWGFHAHENFCVMIFTSVHDHHGSSTTDPVHD